MLHGGLEREFPMTFELGDKVGQKRLQALARGEIEDGPTPDQGSFRRQTIGGFAAPARPRAGTAVLGERRPQRAGSIRPIKST